jgi:hypothetical protein
MLTEDAARSVPSPPQPYFRTFAGAAIVYAVTKCHKWCGLWKMGFVEMAYFRAVV